MTTAITQQRTPQDVTAQFSSLFNYLNRLEEFEDTIITLLPLATDEEVTQTRDYARALGKAGWRIECACDAVILARATNKSKTGIKDVEGTGKIAAAKERAKAIDKTPSTVRRNAQIFNTLVKPLMNVQQGSPDILDDKGFYEAALRAPNPKKAIRMFTKEKRDNPNFCVRDAFRLAKELKSNRPKVNIPDQADYLDPHFKSFLLDLENTLNSFANRCPRPEFKIRVDQWIRATRFERARTPQSDFDSVVKQVDEGATTIEEIAEEVYLSEAEIDGFCVQAIGCPRPTKDCDPREAGTDYEWRPIGVNTEMARGTRQYGIFRKDAPHYAGRSNYSPTVDWEE